MYQVATRILIRLYCAIITHMSKKILVIEDEPDIREAIAETLSDEGFDVTTASDGMDGLAKALEVRPDLILLDIVMPQMDGHETLEKLRNDPDPWGRSVKVVMLTSMDSAKNVADAYKETISDYIIKSHNSLDEIVKKVKMILFDA